MKIARAALAAILIFAAGLCSGIVLDRMYYHHEQIVASAIPNTAQLPSPWNQRLEMMRRWDKQLQLTSEQREQIDEIITETQEKMRELWQPIAPAAQLELKSARERILNHLDPQQRQQFEKLSRAKQQKKNEDSSNPEKRRKDHAGSSNHPPGEPKP